MSKDKELLNKCQDLNLGVSCSKSLLFSYLLLLSCLWIKQAQLFRLIDVQLGEIISKAPMNRSISSFTDETHQIWKNITADSICSGIDSTFSFTCWAWGHYLPVTSEDVAQKHKLTSTGCIPSPDLPRRWGTAPLSFWEKICISMTGINSDYLKGQAKQ